MLAAGLVPETILLVCMHDFCLLKFTEPKKPEICPKFIEAEFIRSQDI
jgi:hypothetical protein